MDTRAYWIMGLLVVGSLLRSAVRHWSAKVIATRLDQRLAKPELDGIPLPAVDDERWHQDGTSVIRLGWCRSEYDYFTLYVDGGAVYLNSDRLGYFKEYVDAIQARLTSDYKLKQVDRALKLIAGE
jgi:hypothetical protein